MFCNFHKSAFPFSDFKTNNLHRLPYAQHEVVFCISAEILSPSQWSFHVAAAKTFFFNNRSQIDGHLPLTTLLIDQTLDMGIVKCTHAENNFQINFLKHIVLKDPENLM